MPAPASTAKEEGSVRCATKGAAAVDESVTRTARDALQAKYSAVAVGNYRPSSMLLATPDNDGAATATATTADDHDESSSPVSYESLLRRMAERVGGGRGGGGATTGRQSPLVNAGYAIRVSCVLGAVRSFLSYHHNGSGGGGGGVQVVVLGAGLDVTGLWCCCCLTSFSPSPVSVSVFEIDAPSVCDAKGAALADLIRSGGIPDFEELRPYEAEADGGGAVSFRGEMTSSEKSDERASSEYALVKADLKDLKMLERVLLPLIRPNLPTLVVSELVLAYLGHDGADRLLGWCSTNLVRNHSSCLVAWEPLGPATSSTDPANKPLSSKTSTGIVSVAEGYRRSYCRQFVNKLERGRAKDTNKNARAEAHNMRQLPFDPLGSSCSAVERRLRGRHCGFARVHVVLAGTAAATLASAGGDSTTCCLLKTEELFDEHAALALHLRSYALVCAFGASADPIFRLCMCPWLDGDAPPQKQTLGDGTAVWLTRIERKDERSIRTMFSESYRDLFEDHPAVRKMVKTALRKDLGAGGGSRPETDKEDSDNSQSKEEEEPSVIRDHYKDSGGFFLVAVTLCSSDTAAADEDDDSSSKLLSRPHHRRVIGGIGIRRLAQKEIRSRGLESNSFEIHRFIVEKSFHGRGVGKALLRRVTEILCKRRLSSTTGSRKLQILATTPTILERANHFYPSAGFKVLSQSNIGDLNMRTYSKTVGEEF